MIIEPGWLVAVLPDFPLDFTVARVRESEHFAIYHALRLCRPQHGSGMRRMRKLGLPFSTGQAI
jgi:hypothetical protein